MLKYSLVILSALFNVARSADANEPLSKKGNGFDSIQLMLKRDQTKKPSYFYYPMTIHDEEFNM